MTIQLKTKQKAFKLRKSGYSLNEISEKLPVSKSTLSSWFKNLTLSPENRQKINKKILKGQRNSNLALKKQILLRQRHIDKNSKKILSKLKNSPTNDLLLCSFLYWSEGTKNINRIEFANSDHRMIFVFINLLRKSYPLDESKFRCLVHIHDYHDENTEICYWSKITSIPKTQFHKSYLKSHTGTRKKADYHGTLSLRYLDSKIAEQLKSIYNTYCKVIGV